MLDETTALPDDPDDLRAFTARLLAEVKAQAILIEKLRHQLAGQRAHRFGASSETAEQLQLALESSEIAAAAMTARLRLPDVEEKDKPKRRPIPDHIPRMEVELTTGEQSCSGCGGTLRRLGEDITEELEYVPGRFIVNRIVRPRLACSGCERFVQAPLPSRPIERGRPGPGLLAHVLVSKFARPSSPLPAEPDLSTATASTSTGPPWRTGLARRRRCSNLWPTRSAGTYWSPRRSSPMTPRSRCSRRAPAGRRPHGSGPTSETKGPGAATHRRPRGIASPAIGRGGTRRITWRTSGDGCTPTVSTAAEKPATGRRNSLPLGDPELMLGRGARLGTRAPRIAGVCQGALA